MQRRARRRAAAAARRCPAARAVRPPRCSRDVSRRIYRRRSTRDASRANGAARGRGGRTLGGTVGPAPERDRRAARRGRAAHRRRLGDRSARLAARAWRFLCRADVRGSSTCTGSFSRAACWLSTCGTQTLGMPSVAGYSSWCATAACSHCCRWQPRNGSAGSCSPAISPPHRRSSRSRTRSMRRSAATAPPGRGSRSPVSWARGRGRAAGRGHDSRCCRARRWSMGGLAPLVDCGSLQRPRPLRRGARRRAAGAAYPPDLHVSSWALSELVEAAARCGQLEAAARRARTARGDGARVRHRLGTRRRRPRSRARGGRRRRGEPVPRRDRAPRAHTVPHRTRSRAPALRRVAAPREAPRGRACAAPRRP